MKILCLNRNHNHTPLPILPKYHLKLIENIETSQGPETNIYSNMGKSLHTDNISLIHRSLWMINQDKPRECGPTLGITKIHKINWQV